MTHQMTRWPNNQPNNWMVESPDDEMRTICHNKYYRLGKFICRFLQQHVVKLPCIGNNKEFVRTIVAVNHANSNKELKIHN